MVRTWIAGKQAARSFPRELPVEVVRAVRHACATKAPVSLTSLPAPGATAFFDGGGRVRAPAGHVHGTEQVARSLLTLVTSRPRTVLHTRSVNGRTGLVVPWDGRGPR